MDELARSLSSPTTAVAPPLPSSDVSKLRTAVALPLPRSGEVTQTVLEPEKRREPREPAKIAEAPFRDTIRFAKKDDHGNFTASWTIKESHADVVMGRCKTNQILSVFSKEFDDGYAYLESLPNLRINCRIKDGLQEIDATGSAEDLRLLEGLLYCAVAFIDHAIIEVQPKGRFDESSNMRGIWSHDN